MSVTIGQMQTPPNPALLNQAGMQGLAGLVGPAAGAEVQSAQRLRRPALDKTGKVAPSVLQQLLGADISFDDVRADIAQGIDSSINAAVAAHAEAHVLEEFKEALDGLMDSIDGQGGLDTWLDSLADSHGQGDARKLMASANRLTEGLKVIGGRIEGLRSQTDDQICTTIEDVNGLLNGLAATSQRIAVEAVCGGDPSYLFEDRDEKLALLFALLDVVSFIRGDGSAAVYLRGGSPLIEGPMAKRLGFTKGGAVSLEGLDVGAELHSGRLCGLLSLRDRHLAGLAGQLDTLSEMIRDQVNRLFNRSIGAQHGAGSSYSGSRQFLNPNDERVSIGGGDCVITLFDDDGTVVDATTVALLTTRHLLAQGFPPGYPFSISLFTDALDQWLRAALKSDTVTAFLDGSGHLYVTLPRGRLTLRDQRCTALDSRPFPDASKPLGLSGVLSLRDVFGNGFHIQVLPIDSLQDIATKAEGSGGLQAAIVSQRLGQMLRLNNIAGSDMYMEPDLPGQVGPAATLCMLPASALPATDLAIDVDIDGQGPHLESAPWGLHNHALGLNGVLSLVCHDGRRTDIDVDPAMTLAALIGQINALGGQNGLSALMKGAGNRWMVRINAQPGIHLRAEGPIAGVLGLRPPPDASYRGVAEFFGLNDFFASTGRRNRVEGKSLMTGFVTANPMALIVTQREGRRQSLSFAAGVGLAQVVNQVNQTDSLMRAELIGTGDNAQRLVLHSTDGAPMQVSGSLAALLALGDGQQARAEELQTRPDLLEEFLPASASRLMRDALSAPISVSVGSPLPAGNQSLRQLAGGILARHRRHVAEGHAMMVYQRTLSDSLRRHRYNMSNTGMNMDRDATIINTYRDAYLENASVMSGLSRLAAELFAETGAVH